MLPHPADGPSNFVDPASQATINMAVGIPLCILALIATCLRLLSNLKNTRHGKLGADDFFCVFGFIVVTIYLAIGITMRHMNRHSWDVPLSFLDPTFSKFQSCGESSMVIPKVAIFILYMRLFSVEKWVKYTSWVCITLLGLYFWSAFSVVLATCAPVEGAWIVRTECATIVTQMGVLGGAIAVATDLVIFVLPLRILYNIHMDARKKLGLMMVFTIGILGVICSIVSLCFRIKISNAYDKLWDAAIVQSCAFAEGYITIVVGCTPAIYSLWANQISKLVWYLSLVSNTSRSNDS